jgi:hypothetical protein
VFCCLFVSLFFFLFSHLLSFKRKLAFLLFVASAIGALNVVKENGDFADRSDLKKIARIKVPAEIRGAIAKAAYGKDDADVFTFKAEHEFVELRLERADAAVYANFVTLYGTATRRGFYAEYDCKSKKELTAFEQVKESTLHNTRRCYKVKPGKEYNIEVTMASRGLLGFTKNVLHGLAGGKADYKLKVLEWREASGPRRVLEATIGDTRAPLETMQGRI